MELTNTPARPAALKTLLCLATLAAAAGAHSTPTALAPLYAGSFAPGTGSDARFVQIDPNWHGSSVLWTEPVNVNTPGYYGSGVAIGTFGWGTGLWGRADWDLIQATAAGSGGPGAPTIVNQWTGQVSSINYANPCYNNAYSGTWGPAAALPFDAGACGANPGNWTSHFSGFVRVTEASLYNFSVLYDDGFFFRLIGEGGQTLEIGKDFLNSRDRLGFAGDLDLSVGLYGFELGSWNRLEAGVVDLRWSRDEGTTWTPVPTTNLVPGSAVDEPALPLLLLSALAAALAVRRRPAGPIGA